MNEAAALPSPRVLLSRQLKRYYGRLRRPPGSRPLPGSPPVIGRGRSGALRRIAGPGRASQVPAATMRTFRAPYAGESFGAASRLSTPSMAFTMKHAARLSLTPPKGGRVTTRQASLDATDRSLASPKGLSTLGFDLGRFQTKPPACYRASWQLPGPDFHRQATTSTNGSRTHLIALHSSWHTVGSR
jgi:hypothetical protein